MNNDMTNLEKTFSPANIENKWYEYWEKSHTFFPKHNSHSDPYCIVLPPPNVTGTLHMGHGFGFTLIDILIRYHHLKGHNTLWQGGTDHAGIATQLVVERQLTREGLSRHDLGRELFLEKIWQWKNISGKTISKQLRRLGAAIDWSRERFTLDKTLSAAVLKVFIELYDEGLIYRGKRLVNWDPQLGTAVSDLEVIHHEEEGSLWYIRYPLINSSDHLIVATTRPETLLGDAAVAVHPEDERYQKYIGQIIQLPCTQRQIPVIADKAVDKTFGTGCVKITPAHDFNDFAMGTRHQLDLINIFTPDAKLNDNVSEQYRGLDRTQARKKILADLTELNLLEKTEKHTLSVPRGEKTDAVIEPYLTDQWYVRSSALAKPAIEVVENGELKFVPEHWNKTYFQWMNNIEDWCISRQLWWGHRIPVWYDEKGNHYAGENENHVRQKYQLSSNISLKQDEDVLDTWFSAALWPFSSLGWPENTPDFKTFFPTQTLVTGFDIIFFWVARMIMMSLKFTGKIPFKTVYITGLIRDAEGKKMSKTRGNVLDPLDLIDGIDLKQLIAKRTLALTETQKEKITHATTKEFPEGITAHGTDALRFTFCALASYNRDIRFDMQRLAGNKFFCNKLWNAARFILMYCDNKNNYSSEKYHLSLADQWMQSKLQHLIVQTEKTIAEYRFDLLAQQLYEFVWNDFCDWYVEWIKPVLAIPSPKKNSGIAALLHVFSAVLQLLHPIMPFITAEIWQALSPHLNNQSQDILQTQFPSVDTNKINKNSENHFVLLQNIVIAIRTLRSENKIAPNVKLPVYFKYANANEKSLIQQEIAPMKQLTKASDFYWLDAEQAAPEFAIKGFLNTLEIFLVPEIITKNTTEELAKLQKEKIAKEKIILAMQGKLANPDFCGRAPKAVVEKEKNKLQAEQTALEKINQLIEQLEKKNNKNFISGTA